MNNLGLHQACTSCTKRIIESVSTHENVVVTISNIKKNRDKCTIEDGLLGGECGNDANYYLNIVETDEE